MEKLLSSLLVSNSPSVKFRVLTELMDYDINSSEVKNIKQEILSSEQVLSIFSKMHPDGYWLQTNPKTGVISGKGVEYGAFATTHFVLSYLSELGLNRSDKYIHKAANRYLDLVSDDGDWWRHMSCLYALNIRTFIRLGYEDDTRLQKAINLMLNTSRPDGGYLCDMHERPRKAKKSCYRGAVKALLAFSELPTLWAHPRCNELISYFLEREVVYNSSKSDYVNKDVELNSFPITWRANTFEALLALSKMGYGKHKSIVLAWELLEKSRIKSGKYILNNTPVQSPFKVGKKGQENDWVSFYVLLAKRYAGYILQGKT